MAEPKHILVVDDEEDLRAIVRMTLQAAGYEVTEAPDGKQALELLGLRKPDMMVLDIMMPKMNGIEVCNRMIEKLKITDVPVLVLSAVSEKSKIIRDFMELPIQKKAFIRKPLETQDLVDWANETLGGSGAAPRAVAPTSSRPAKRQQVRPTRAHPTPQAKPAPVAKKPPVEKPKGPSYRVLAIDDEEDIRIILKTTLSLRHTVETAENGMVALEKIDAFDPDFVISDMRMPVMNGLQTIEAIRAHPRFANVPVFFLTGETSKELPKKAFGLGANLFLRKPIEPMQLLKTIDFFVKESGLQPKPPAQARPKPVPKAKPPQAGAAAQAPETNGKVRVLVVDENPETMSLIKRALVCHVEDDWEALWAPEVKKTLVNLDRWEPDVIFYNPRNLHMDGIAFVQSLKLKKTAKKYQIALVGTQFFDADLAYSKRSLHREVIRFKTDPESTKADLMKVIEEARAGIAAKQHSLVEIEAEEQELMRKVARDEERSSKQRENFREKFARIQKFIDGEAVM